MKGQPHSMLCREATTAESREIAALLEREQDREAVNAIERIVVLPNFISDGPGYRGNIYIVLFGGGPEFTMVLEETRSLRITRLEPPPDQCAKYP